MSTRYPTSGKLVVADVTSDTGAELLMVTQPWWIDTGVTGWAFKSEDAAGRQIGKLEESGRLWLLPGLLYDGSSGPTVDEEGLDEVPAGLHDFLYRAIGAGDLPMAAKPMVDQFYVDLLAERGMSPYWHPVKPKPWWKFWHVFNPGYKTRGFGLRTIGGMAASIRRGGQKYRTREAA